MKRHDTSADSGPGSAANLQQWLSVVHPWRCVMCRQPARQAMDLCPACADDLPLLQLRCQRCAEPLTVEAAMCGRCQQRSPAYDRVFAVYLYAQPLQRLITAFKYQRQQAMGRVLAESCARHIAAAIHAGDLEKPQALLPVPLHRWRLLRRGFNQSWLIATDMQRVLRQQGIEVPVLATLLQRHRRTRPQAGLDLAARRRNLRNAFRCLGQTPGDLPEHVCLVDDVMTSGSTAEACARLLKQAGCARVDVWVMARAGKLD